MRHPFFNIPRASEIFLDYMGTAIVVQFALLLLWVMASFPAHAQNSAHTKPPGVGKVASPPTARNFAYPQSLFVDSQNGNIWVTDFDNNRVMRFDVSSLTNVVERGTSLRAEQYTLAQNYPNPFNPSTTITFAIRTTAYATLSVNDLLGRNVAILFDGVATAHTVYVLSFDARDLPSGIYFYKLHAANRTEVRKMALLR